MLSNQKEDSDLPSWTKFPLKEFKVDIKDGEGVVMDDHVVVLVQDESVHRNEREYGLDYDSDEEEPATILAFSLKDHSVQEAKINISPFIYQQGDFHFLKYGENQIIKYGGEYDIYGAESMICITVESFKPFKVKCEVIKDEKKNYFKNTTAQIYKDCLYVYGRVKDKGNEIWSFDLKNRTWKLCETTGEVPPDSCDHFNSVFYQDNLCVHGLRSLRSRKNDDNLFMLNLNSMAWTKIEQEYSLVEHRSTVHKDHFVTIDRVLGEEDHGACFLNLQTKEPWKTFEIKGLGLHDSYLGGPMIYKNSLLSLATAEVNKNLILTMMNMDKFEIVAPKSAEEEEMSSLFMSQTESDIALKIGEKITPVHKSVLMKKSRYFEGLFKSGMAESTQEVIEIKDCEPDLFQEYLRFIYQDKVELNDENQAIKLYTLADKYLEEDLCDKCLNYLASILNMSNVYTILEFAHKENLPLLKSWCLKCFKDKINRKNIAELVKYLADRQDNSELKNFTFNFILDNFFEIHKNEKGNMQIYENFLVKNIGMDTISPLARFLSRESLKKKEKSQKKNHYEEEDEEDDEENYEEDEDDEKDEYRYEFDYVHGNGKKATAAKSQDLFEEWTTVLKEAALHFGQEHAEIIMASKFAKDFSHAFMRDLFLYTTKNLRKIEIENKTLKNEKKRMEPSQKNESVGEEGHDLKKTKKSDLA